MNQKILIINITLLIIILMLGYLVATTRYTPPQKFNPDSAPAAVSGEDADGADPGRSETEYAPPAQASPHMKPPDREIAGRGEDKYPDFGKAPIFDTIIPKPTPRPTPTPKPPAKLDIKDITARWQMNSMFGTTASFTDSGTKKEWTMNVGDVEVVKFRNQDCPVKLENVNENDFKVTISYEDQTREISMF